MMHGRRADKQIEIGNAIVRSTQLEPIAAEDLHNRIAERERLERANQRVEAGGRYVSIWKPEGSLETVSIGDDAYRQPL